ncbi:MAG: 2-succinyl-6-hydroxy-2,4-cyclohexadiene-carboxylate synthase [Thermoleophilaceae bacterium]|nr:2-succinyl-6-hydroxy-2,4-cyclohexadiene-carboxylate synthase [Thermoleophilaceae bacterium]
MPRNVTFVPGFMQRGESWQPVAARLAERYRVSCLDFATWTFEQRLDEMPTGGAVVGYSMGGRLALHAALREPGRYASLVLVGVSAGVADRDERRRADEALAGWMEQHSIEAVVERWERQPVFSTQSPELRAQQRAGRLTHDPRKLAQLLRSAGQGVLEPVWDRLPELRCPVLLMAGELDRPYAAAAKRMAERIPGARVRIVPGAGHAPQLEQPRLVAEFLDEHLCDGGVVDREA